MGTRSSGVTDVCRRKMLVGADGGEGGEGPRKSGLQRASDLQRTESVCHTRRVWAAGGGLMARVL